MNYFLGSHGTGKSTLVEEILKINPNFVTMEGLSRPLEKGLRKSGFDFDQKKKQIIHNEVELSLNDFSHKVRGGIATRSLIDQIIYSKVVDSLVDTTDLEIAFKKQCRYIEKIFILPIEFPLKEDSVRTGMWFDPVIQGKIQVEMERFLLKHIFLGLISSLQVVYLRGTVEERMKTLQKHIRLT
jgi:hypothetical protein